jgi:hypothetical protein
MGVAIPQIITEDRASGALVVDGSLRFAQSNTQYLTRTPSSNGDRTRWTVSLWCKRHSLGGGSGGLRSIIHTNAGSQETILAFWSDDAIFFWDYNSAYTTQLKTVGVAFRDVSSWYHIVLSVDTTQSTDTERIKLYVNNVRQIFTNVAPHGYIAQNTQTRWNSALISQISGGYYKNDCSITNIYNIDGQALDASYFGYTDALTNTWRPKKFKPAATTNDGTTWSSSGNFSGNVRSQGDSYGPPKMFNGIIGNESTTGAVCFAPYSSDSTCTWTSPTTFTGLTSLRLYVDLSGTTGKLTVNGVDYSSLVTALSGGDGWITIPQSSLSTISFGYTGGLNSATGIAAVEVNGVTLLDSDTTNIGTNGFFLPFDGSAPIGQDQSGRGNNWTPVNFGGSNTLEKATGALPILNTDGGGKVARVGVRTDSSASSLVLALPLVGIKSDFSNAINSGTSNKAITANGGISGSSAQSNFYGGSYLFDGSNDYLSSSSADYGFSSGTAFTIEGWFYANSLPASADGSGGGIFGNRGSVESNAFTVYIGSSSSNTIGVHVGGGTATFFNAPGGLKTSTWNHIAMVRNTSNTVEFFVNGISIGTGSPAGDLSNGAMYIGCYGAGGGAFFNGYLQDFRIYKGLAKYTQNFIPASTDPDILPDTPSGVSYTSNLTQITDGAISSGSASSYLTLASSADFGFGTGDFTIEFFVYETAKVYTGESNPRAFDFGATFQMVLHSTADGSTIRIDYADSTLTTSNGTLFANKWNHIALVRSGSTLSLYINGVFDKSVSNSTNVPTPSSTIYIGRYYNSNSGWINGFISNLHVVKGTALYTTNFTPPTGPISSVANTKLLCCKSNSSATAFDVSPGTITANGNAAATNFNPFTVNINTQRGKQSGWATLDPLRYSGTMTFSNGNLNVSGTAANASSNIAVRSGKWYAEFVYSAIGSTVGLVAVSNKVTADALAGATQTWQLGYTSAGKLENASSQSNTSTFTTGDVISVAFDCSTGTATFYKNNISVGSVTNSAFANVDVVIGGGYGGSNGSDAYAVNFGQKPFKFPPPAGFQPLALANTPRPTIVRPDQFVGVTTYSGDGTTEARAINVGFKPDFVWIKGRNTAYSHLLYDTVRGIGPLKGLNSNETRAEGATVGDDATYGYLSSFNNNGFSVIKGSDATSYTNGGSSNYVAWAWKAGGNSNTFNINDVGYATASAAGLTAGTITLTGASVNTKSGFSIIKYRTSGSGTVAHGLTQAPQVSIAKRMNGTGGWYFRVNIGSINGYLLLNTTDGLTGSFSVTSTTVQGADFGSSNEDWILYNWHEVPGFSKFGSYTGNGSSDGPMVITGFRPRWILFKRTDNTSNWFLLDTARNTYNPVNSYLMPNSSSAEDANNSTVNTDFTSNGFKIRATTDAMNASSATYIYAAFAETPTQNLYGAQSNAR